MLLRLGSRGREVKELQNTLNTKGFNAGKADGIFGANTDKAVRQFQKSNGLKVDGIVGPATIAKLKSINKPASNKSIRKSKYYKKGDIHIIETTPDNIEIKLIGNNLHNAGVYGINGTFYNMKEYNRARACWAIATNEGKSIGGNAMLNSYNRSIKRGTIVYYKDGAIEVKRVNSINEFSKPHVWAMGGYSVYPYFDLKAEKCPGAINYRTAHSYIAYKIVKGKPHVYLFVKPYHMIRDILPFVREMKFDGCIVVDGGGSSQLRHPNGKFKQSRRVNNAVILKEV